MGLGFSIPVLLFYLPCTSRPKSGINWKSFLRAESNARWLVAWAVDCWEFLQLAPTWLQTPGEPIWTRAKLLKVLP